ncbi:MAG TPA: hypothetical protein VE645_06940, partial [Pseudonocardiaceae bacterium]|nr:hypothetical protein [Pseudonocardiaceae bacterium]
RSRPERPGDHQPPLSDATRTRRGSRTTSSRSVAAAVSTRRLAGGHAGRDAASHGDGEHLVMQPRFEG